uniref:ATP-binding cassette sub-family B member 6 n=1 Tax=Tabanus bromius TaxID=304241 RepID=A0A0K8TS80_TABBR
MLYCPPNITFSQIWVNHGLSHCFLDTFSSSIIALFLILGAVQLIMYRRYATPVPNFHGLRRNWLYIMQLTLISLFPLLAVGRILLETFLFGHGEIYIFKIVFVVLIVVAYPFSICLIIKERFYLLPSIPIRRHGLILLTFWFMMFAMENLALINIKDEDWWFHPDSKKKKVEMTFFVLRYCCTLGIFILGLIRPGLAPLEGEQLLTDDEEVHQSAFKNAFKKLWKLAPFLWPKKDALLQIRVLICILLLLGGRVTKLYLPLFRKEIVDSLTIKPIEFRWDLVLYYVLLSFLQGGGTGTMGLMNNLRSFLWIRIQQYTTREIEVELFRHLHNLSLRWHLQRKTGEVLRVMDRGTDSINNLLNYILFSISPTIVDIIVSVIFFVLAFNWLFGLIVFVTMLLYILATIFVTEWRTKYQRRMNLADNEQKARSVDSLLNFETVKYYGNENYEVDAYQNTILKYQKEEWYTLLSLNILNTSQNIILCAGLLAGSLLCVSLVAHGQGLTVGDYVLFFTYLMDLYMPLNWFGTYYRAIQKNFVDMENMFDLLKEEEDVIDAPGATPLLCREGRIEFKNVTFGYTPERFVLKNVSFTVEPGKTSAIVGHSGGGKSTIVRLLFRFYDVNSGSIMIDGENIKLVTQESLRRAIGVVPQDTVLFNNTVFYNIEYGRLGASKEQVFEAAKSADIHERILSFPDRYDTTVGERGLRLSGGEKQRIAIARTILKSPSIVLLDEATSALDTQTERNIQSALQRVCANRTTIIIAHRLSTIRHADEILVLKEGSIVERGRHSELLDQKGLYAQMWNQQELESLSEQQSKAEVQPELSTEDSQK